MNTEAKDEGMERALDICNKLEQIAKAQYAAIVDDNVGRLLETIDERERLISSLDLGAASLDPHTSTAANLAGFKDKHSVVVEKIRELLRIDEENQKVLKARLAELKAQLGQVRRGRQAIGRYAYLKPQPQPIYIDKQR